MPDSPSPSEHSYLLLVALRQRTYRAHIRFGGHCPELSAAPRRQEAPANGSGNHDGSDSQNDEPSPPALSTMLDWRTGIDHPVVLSRCVVGHSKRPAPPNLKQSIAQAAVSKCSRMKWAEAPG